MRSISRSSSIELSTIPIGTFSTLNAAIRTRRSGSGRTTRTTRARRAKRSSVVDSRSPGTNASEMTTKSKMFQPERKNCSGSPVRRDPQHEHRR